MNLFVPQFFKQIVNKLKQFVYSLLGLKQEAHTSVTEKEKEKEKDLFQGNPFPFERLNEIDFTLPNHSTPNVHGTTLSEVINNLMALRKVMQEPREINLARRFAEINYYLGPAESYETNRQERWKDKIVCPYCGSHNVKAYFVPENSNIASYYRYQCANCGTEFDDSTGTPFEHGIPPLQVWMQCWYLLGCTDSITFIASQLNLDKLTVEKMINQLKLIFESPQPSNQSLSLTDKKNQSFTKEKSHKDELLRSFERLNADVSTQPRDTAEFRRQQQKRRDPRKSHTKPPGTKF